MMSFTSTIFDEIRPFCDLDFSIPNPGIENRNPLLTSNELHVKILDSGGNRTAPIAAAVLVPNGRETDWVFNSPAGLLQLRRRFYNISRLFLVSNKVEYDIKKPYSVIAAADEEIFMEAEAILTPVLTKFLPLFLKEKRRPYKIRFIRYSDGIEYRRHHSSASDRVTHPLGRSLLEDEARIVDGRIECYKMVTFEGTGNLVHAKMMAKPVHLVTRIPIYVDDVGPNVDWNSVDFVADLENLVDPISKAMLIGYEQVASNLDQEKKTYLCMGGTLLPLVNFLLLKEKQSVLWMERDVNLFPLLESLCSDRVGFNLDPMLLINPPEDLSENSPIGKRLKSFRQEKRLFDVIFVNLMAPEQGFIWGVCSPPRSMIKGDILRKLKALIPEKGTIIFNVVSPDLFFYVDFIEELKKLFPVLIKIRSVKFDHFDIVVASTSGASKSPETSGFLHKALKMFATGSDSESHSEQGGGYDLEYIQKKEIVI